MKEFSFRGHGPYKLTIAAQRMVHTCYLITAIKEYVFHYRNSTCTVLSTDSQFNYSPRRRAYSITCLFLTYQWVLYQLQRWNVKRFTVENFSALFYNVHGSIALPKACYGNRQRSISRTSNDHSIKGDVYIYTIMIYAGDAYIYVRSI